MQLWQALRATVARTLVLLIAVVVVLAIADRGPLTGRSPLGPAVARRGEHRKPGSCLFLAIKTP
jgi:hypothetical protein